MEQSRRNSNSGRHCHNQFRPAPAQRYRYVAGIVPTPPQRNLTIVRQGRQCNRCSSPSENNAATVAAVSLLHSQHVVTRRRQGTQLLPLGCSATTRAGCNASRPSAVKGQPAPEAAPSFSDRFACEDAAQQDIVTGMCTTCTSLHKYIIFGI